MRHRCHAGRDRVNPTHNDGCWVERSAAQNSDMVFHLAEFRGIACGIGSGTLFTPPVLRALRLALPFTKMPSNGLMGHGEPRPTEEARSVPSN